MLLWRRTQPLARVVVAFSTAMALGLATLADGPPNVGLTTMIYVLVLVYALVQHLTADTGNVHLDRQISTVITLMRISTSNSEFEDLFARAFAPQLRLPVVIDPASYRDAPKQ